MGLKNLPEQPSEESQRELGAEEKAARITEIKAEITQWEKRRRSASSAADFGGAGRIAHKKMGDISEKIRELKAELARLGVNEDEQSN